MSDASPIEEVTVYDARWDRRREDGMISSGHKGYFCEYDNALEIVNQQKRLLGHKFESGSVSEIRVVRVGDKFYRGGISKIIESSDLDNVGGEEVSLRVGEDRIANIFSDQLEVRDRKVSE